MEWALHERRKILHTAFLVGAVAACLASMHLTSYYPYRLSFADTIGTAILGQSGMINAEVGNEVGTASINNSTTPFDPDAQTNGGDAVFAEVVGGTNTDLTVNLESQVDTSTLDEISAFIPWLVIGSTSGIAALMIILRSKNGKGSKSAPPSSIQLTGCLKELEQRNAVYLSSNEDKKKGKNKSRKNRRWIALYIVVVVLWGVVFSTTVRSWIVGTEAVVDSVDISYFTLPALVFNLVFVGATFLIFGAYFRFHHRAVIQQRHAKNMLQNKKSVRNNSGVSDTLGNNPRYSEEHCGNNERPEELYRAVTNWIALGCSPRTSLEANQTEHLIDLDYSQAEGTRELVSIIIPARDEENVIGNTILNCLRQSYTNIEVIVVCHNCSDKTYAQAKVVADSRVRPFELNTKEAGKGIALNYGVQRSTGKYLLILDGDGKLNDSFIEDALPLFAADNYAAVQGRFIPSNRNYDFVTRMLSLEGDLWSTPFMTFRSIGTKRTPLGGTGYIIRKDALLNVGGFANHLVDDYELTFRLLRRNYRIAYAPLCINYDEKPPNLDIMLKQRARWLRGFLNLTKSRVAEPRDVIGHLYWVNPLTAFTGLALLLIAAYSTIHYLVFLYYPFHYSYIPITLWFYLTLATFGVYTAALVVQYGKSGFRYAAWLPIYLPFSNYYMIVALKAFFVKSWAETKTVHGFVAENVQGRQSTILGEKGV